MYSMTGFGKADYKTRQLSLSVEVSSVNNRFLEFSIRLPRQMQFLEPRVKELISNKVNRGKINLTVNYEDHGFGIDKVSINMTLAEEVVMALKTMKKKYHLAGEVEVEDLLNFPEIFKIDKVGNLEKRIWPPLSQVINKALDGMLIMRRKEGNNLKKDIISRIAILLKKIKAIEGYAPQNMVAYRERLAKKIKDVLDNRTVDGARFEEEVAFMAERSDITEECVRFGSHLKQFTSDLKQDHPVGKRLNFILQELNREANTIGSKTTDTRIAHLALELKEEVEKIREQVQNIE
jgi:uncharacterized protein (TIGR00255 family)